MVQRRRPSEPRSGQPPGISVHVASLSLCGAANAGWGPTPGDGFGRRLPAAETRAGRGSTPIHADENESRIGVRRRFSTARTKPLLVPLVGCCLVGWLVGCLLAYWQRHRRVRLPSDGGSVPL